VPLIWVFYGLCISDKEMGVFIALVRRFNEQIILLRYRHSIIMIDSWRIWARSYLCISNDGKVECRRNLSIRGNCLNVNLLGASWSTTLFLVASSTTVRLCQGTEVNRIAASQWC
jgi:hypothetical protein